MEKQPDASIYLKIYMEGKNTIVFEGQRLQECIGYYPNDGHRFGTVATGAEHIAITPEAKDAFRKIVAEAQHTGDDISCLDISACYPEADGKTCDKKGSTEVSVSYIGPIATRWNVDEVIADPDFFIGCGEGAPDLSLLDRLVPISQEEIEEKKLRLLLTEQCNRDCSGCCNKDWELSKLPVCTDYTKYKMIMLTGGEPMLQPELVMQAIDTICRQTNAPIILYTADLSNWNQLMRILERIDGITVTLHTPEDTVRFKSFDRRYQPSEQIKERMRLNVFAEAGSVEAKPYWMVKRNMQWIKNCPLPEKEIFMRYQK